MSRNILRNLATFCARWPSGTPDEAASPDLSDAINYVPSADLTPDPRLLQRKNQELEARLKSVEDWIAKRDRGFRSWLIR